MPTAPFLEDLEHHTFETYSPDREEIRETHNDEEMIRDSVNMRDKEAGNWKWAASRWNLLTEPIDDPRISNVLLPFVRMIASTKIASMAQAKRKNVYKPRQRIDDPKALLWQSANDHIDNASSMPSVMDEFYTNLTVFGNAALEDYVQIPYISKRTKVGKDWEYKSVRDLSRPKIATRSRSPFEYGFWTGSNNPNEMTPTYTRDFYSFNVFTQEFTNVYMEDGTPKYDNCKAVRPGMKATIGESGEATYEEEDHNGVVVYTVYDPVRDIMRRYANGIRIQDISLRSYLRTQKSPIAIGTMNHKYDDNLRVSSPYGYGDTHLIRGLDSLYQAIGNLNIDNYKLANTNLISVRNNGGVTALDTDIDYLSAVRIDGDVIVSPMGTVRLGDYGAFKTMIDEWAIWTTKTNFQQLVGDTSATAFELQQRIKASNQGVDYTLSRLASGCFKKHAQNRLAFILSDMTVEEYQDLDVAELDMVQELLKKDKVPAEDYKYDEDGKPTQRVLREKITVKNRDLQENFKDGKRSIDDLQDHGQAKGNSEVTVVPEYFWPVEYIESGAIPDIEVEIDLGAERELRFQKTQFLSNFARQRIAEAANFPQVDQLQTKFDAGKIDAMLTRDAGMTEDQVMTDLNEDEEVSELDDTISAVSDLISPKPNAQSAQPVQAPVGVQNVDASGLGAFAEQPSAAANPVNRAEAGAYGAA